MVLPTATTAAKRAWSALSSVTAKIGEAFPSADGMKKFADFSKYMPYENAEEVAKKIDALKDDQPQKGPLDAKVEASVVGPEFDPLSMEPAMLERARETALLAREAMNALIEAL